MWPSLDVLRTLCGQLGLPPPGPEDENGDGAQRIEQVLGRARLRALGAARRRRGAFYTPPVLVDYLVEETLGAWLSGRSPGEVDGLRLLDPACGAGAFLCAAYRRLLRFCRDAMGAELTAATRRRLLLDHVCGVELDAEAAALCRLALALTALDGDDRPETVCAEDLAGLLDDLTERIRCGDALLRPGPRLPPGARAFDWEALGGAGFDVVLGNPPFLGGVQSRTRLPPQLRGHLRETFASARGTIDASVLFQELALDRLRPGGRAGLLVPNKFLAAPYGAAFRALALERADLRVLADLSTARPFPGTAIYPVIYVLEAREHTRKRPPPVMIHRFTSSDDGPRLVERREVALAPSDLVPGAPWTPLLSRDAALLRRLLTAHPPLGSLFQVCAAATADEAYRLRPHLCEGPGDAAAFRFLTSGAIERYGHRHGAGPIRYLGVRFRAPYLPRGCPELSAARRRHYGSQKLVVASMTRRIEALLDDGEVAAAVPAVLVLPRPGAPPLPYLLGLLNSQLLSWIYRQLFSALALAGGHLRVGAAQLGVLPVPSADADSDELRARIAAGAVCLGELAARRRLAEPPAQQALREQQATADRELDRLVYELYGLTTAEVAAVERSRE